MSADVVIAPGMRVLCRDAEWLVTRVDPSNNTGGKAIHCVGADDLVRGHESIFLTQLDKIDPVDPRETQLHPDQSQGYRLAKLFLEAQLRQMPVTGLEPDLDGMGVFRAMKFQENAVKAALCQLRPRLLLADAVGLGKTIQVGMILTELARRGRANRILVLAKKSMLTQFQSELWNRFAIPLVRLDSEGIARLRMRIPAGKNPFEIYHRVIISIDTLKNVARYEHFLKDARWDVIIIDEAHNVAGASVPERHLSHRLARLLSRRSDSILLTTATPHNGKRETFGRLISLLDPSAIPDPNLREYGPDDVKGFFLMRFKEDVRADAGDMLSERRVIPRQQTTIKATQPEETAYGVLESLRREVLSVARDGVKTTGWQSQPLVAYGLYKGFLSSPEACQETVRKRLSALESQDDGHPEKSALLLLKSALSRLSLASSARYRLLTKQLFDISCDGGKKSPRVLIFTEFRKTQQALATSLAKDFKLPYEEKADSQPNQAIATIHGGMSDVQLMKTVEAFATGTSPIRILIATDVASEGINLHHQCHNIIHYDLPWSIITLVQRNGRIDRLGQMMRPVIRYLLVETEKGLLKGDSAIFERLILKVDEINSLRQTGESVLRLYDAQAEEDYVAKKGLLGQDANLFDAPAPATDNEAANLEDMIRDAGNLATDELLKILLGEDDPITEAPTAPTPVQGNGRIRLFSDMKYLMEGYRYLAGTNKEYAAIQQHDSLITLTAPPDLKRRLGAPDERGDVVFGATAIPAEAWPANDEFRFTADPDRADLSIKAARNTSGYWAREALCVERHPVIQWITERLVMQLSRSEAPFIQTPKMTPGALCFCFIGQVSSKAGSPLVVDAHAVIIEKGGKMRIEPLQKVLDSIGFDTIMNTGATPNIGAAKKLVTAAVESSLMHMTGLKAAHEKRMTPILRKEERRLRAWRTRRKDLIASKLETLPDTAPSARRLKKDLEEMEAYVKDREQNWRDTHFLAAPTPSTQLVLVIAGS